MPYILKKYYPLRNIVFFAGEGLLIFLAITGGYIFWGGLEAYLADAPIYLTRAIIVTAVFQTCLYYFDLYDLSVIPHFTESAARTTLAFGFGCMVLSFFYYLFPSVIISTKVFWLGYLTICINIALWRFFYILILRKKMFTRPIALVGSGMLAEKVKNEIKHKKDSGYKVISYIESLDTKPQKFKGKLTPQKKCLSNLGINQYVEKIIIAFDERRGKLPLQKLIDCKLICGVQIVDGIDFYQELTGKVLVEKLNPSSILFSEGFTVGRITKIGKRALDIIFSSFGLLVSLPITLISALIIKLETSGPIFYLQKRIGEKGKIYKVIKFRSMIADAEKGGPVWASKADNRVTRFGQIMRKLRIDEIPQMINVLNGDMSFVGPRPERPIFVKRLEKNIPYYSLRHVVKPGITGWAQVLYPYGASEEDALRKLEYDLFYLKNLSLGMDIWIVFQTIKIVLFQKGSR